MKKCKNCNEEIKDSKLFCNKKCHLEFRKKQSELRKSIRCLYCDTEIMVELDSKQKYCNHNHYKLHKILILQETRICPECNKEFKISKNNKRKLCSKKCRNDWDKRPENKQIRSDNTKKAIKEKYGVDNIMMLEEFRNKAKKTKFEKYGDENYSNRLKMEKTKEERYGDKHYTNREKAKKTSNERYGVDNYTNQEKREQTMMDRYGHKYPMEIEEFVEKSRQTYIERYGGYSFQSPILFAEFKIRMKEQYGNEIGMRNDSIKEKVISTCEERYGGQGYGSSITNEKIQQTMYDKYNGIGNGSEIISDKIKSTSIEKYGVDSYIKTEEFKRQLYNNAYHKFFNTINGKLINHIIPLFTIEEYNGMDKEYEFQCQKCKNNFTDILESYRCPICYPKLNNISYVEQELLNFITSILPQNTNIITNDRKILNGKELDIYLPDYNLAIEMNGVYWHSEIKGKRDKDYHINKTEICESQNIQLIHITDYEWIYKQDIIQYKLKEILNLNEEYNKMSSFSVVEIPLLEKEMFFNLYSLYDTHTSEINIGLYGDSDLISVMSFSKIENNEYIINFANSVKLDSFDILLNYFELTYNPTKLISFVDRRFDNGKLYLNNNFKLITKTEPEYWYIVGDKLKHKSYYNSSQLKTYDENITEWENMQINGYDRIWDCGSLKFEKIY
jgi:hypothetical protein